MNDRNTNTGQARDEYRAYLIGQAYEANLNHKSIQRMRDAMRLGHRWLWHPDYIEGADPAHAAARIRLAGIYLLNEFAAGRSTAKSAYWFEKAAAIDADTSEFFDDEFLEADDWVPHTGEPTGNSTTKRGWRKSTTASDTALLTLPPITTWPGTRENRNARRAYLIGKASEAERKVRKDLIGNDDYDDYGETQLNDLRIEKYRQDTPLHYRWLWHPAHIDSANPAHVTARILIIGTHWLNYYAAGGKPEDYSYMFGQAAPLDDYREAWLFDSECLEVDGWESRDWPSWDDLFDHLVDDSESTPDEPGWCKSVSTAYGGTIPLELPEITVWPGTSEDRDARRAHLIGKAHEAQRDDNWIQSILNATPVRDRWLWHPAHIDSAQPADAAARIHLAGTHMLEEFAAGRSPADAHSWFAKAAALDDYIEAGLFYDKCLEADGWTSFEHENKDSTMVRAWRKGT